MLVTFAFKYLIVILVFLYNSEIVSTSGCGLPDYSFRIIGGTPANSESWPWITLVFVRFKIRNTTISYKCGGSIITDRYILTAAHCFDEYRGQKLLNAKVLLGKYNISTIEPKQVERFAEKVIIHQKYNPKTFQNDIALIKMDRKLDFGTNESHLQPICLPKANKPYNRTNCYAIGWGDISLNRSSSSVLQQVKLPIMDDIYCKSSGKYFNMNIETMLCAGYAEGGKSTCVGDSGGPLMCKSENGAWIQYGITSFGGVCGQKGKPPVFTRVSYYKDWIERNTQMTQLSKFSSMKNF